MHFDLVGRDAFEEALSWDNFGPGASVRFVAGVLYLNDREDAGGGGLRLV